MNGQQRAAKALQAITDGINTDDPLEWSSKIMGTLSTLMQAMIMALISTKDLESARDLLDHNKSIILDSLSKQGWK